MSDLLLKIEDLSVGFAGENGSVVAVTDKVNLEICAGEFFGLAGESGCGKSVTAMSILRLLPLPAARILSGKILWDGKDLLKMPICEMQKLRGSEISMIFQEPTAALDPLQKIGSQLLEVFDFHEWQGSSDTRVHELLQRVGLPDAKRVLQSYPHELSGGMLQRVVFAMALLLKPRLVIADEPTTALDVTVQAGVMELLDELRQENDTAVLFITHNLGLIARYCSRLSVMYAGRVVEESPVEDFFRSPAHPYSRGLLAALPGSGELKAIPGQVPRPEDFADGCRFRDRCDMAKETCMENPSLRSVGENRRNACFFDTAGENP